jgi:hypothetical protein
VQPAFRENRAKKCEVGMFFFFCKKTLFYLLLSFRIAVKVPMFS